MTEARLDSEERREWNRLSHLLATIASAFSEDQVKPAECDPFKQRASSVSGDKEHVSVLKDLFGKGGKDGETRNG
ncbi:MAG: hypothetical protein AAGG38_06355 [Planctomycetota bacterium]